VLGTVQGSPLRFVRACARPSGLDGACAQPDLGYCVMAGSLMTLQCAYLIVDVKFERD
jgi:hypothetical protein